MFNLLNGFVRYVGGLPQYQGRVSDRYLRGLASYGKKVKTEKRKERILAELKAMGVKPRIRVKMGRRVIRKVGMFGKTGLWRAA